MTIYEWMDNVGSGRHWTNRRPAESIIAVETPDLDHLLALARCAVKMRVHLDDDYQGSETTRICRACRHLSYRGEVMDHDPTCPAAEYDRIAAEIGGGE